MAAKMVKLLTDLAERILEYGTRIAF